MTEFLSNWDQPTALSPTKQPQLVNPNQLVSWARFFDFYCDVSAGIEDDVYFEALIRNCWHLSRGGELPDSNVAIPVISCRNILVTHSDGTPLFK